jgi:hypothetical protein
VLRLFLWRNMDPCPCATLDARVDSPPTSSVMAFEPNSTRRVHFRSTRLASVFRKYCSAPAASATDQLCARHGGPVARSGLCAGTGSPRKGKRSRSGGCDRGRRPIHAEICSTFNDEAPQLRTPTSRRPTLGRTTDQTDGAAEARQPRWT